MEIVHERCAGLDVHKKTVVACVVTPEHKEVRTFGTMTRELMGMADWFSSLAVTHVAMESTGVYWRGGGNLIYGGGIKLPLANAPYRLAVSNPATVRHWKQRECGIPLARTRATRFSSS